MALVGSGDSAKALYLLSLVCITTVLAFCQGTEYDHQAQYRYPFIKPASSFSPTPSSAASRPQSVGGSSYDYIIVGGGTAGCPLAATLSQNYTVLLLERGGTPFANANVSFMENFHLTLADISPKSASQMFISTDGVFNSRARVLGGGSSINAGFYTRASTRYDGEKADIWSCGVILFVLLAGYLPFHDSNLMEMYKKIGRGDFKCPHWFPPEVRKLLSRILDPNPNSRITVSKIMENCWVGKGFPRIKFTESFDFDENEDSPRGVLDIIYSDSVASSSRTKEGVQETCLTKPHCMNAFDIISLSPRFNLSGLFESDRPSSMADVWFATRMPPSVVVSKLEEVAAMEHFMFKKNDTMVKMQDCICGRKGPLMIDAEIFEVTPSLHLVEVKKLSGDSMEYHKFCDEELRPSLKDIVWNWLDSGKDLSREQPQQEEHVLS